MWWEREATLAGEGVPPEMTSGRAGELVEALMTFSPGPVFYPRPVSVRGPETTPWLMGTALDRVRTARPLASLMADLPVAGAWLAAFPGTSF